MKKILTAVFLLFSSSAFAAVESGYRNIEDIGCHLNDRICFATLSGIPVGPVGCSHVSIRWETRVSDIGAKNGNAILSMLMAAHAAGRQVNFGVSEACFGPQPAFPTFIYLRVK